MYGSAVSRVPRPAKAKPTQRQDYTHVAIDTMYHVLWREVRDLRVGLDKRGGECVNKVLPLFLGEAVDRFCVPETRQYTD